MAVECLVPGRKIVFKVVGGTPLLCLFSNHTNLLPYFHLSMKCFFIKNKEIGDPTFKASTFGKIIRNLFTKPYS